VWKWLAVKDKHIKMKSRIYVGLLFVFDLDGECKFIKNKILQLLYKYVLGCHLLGDNNNNNSHDNVYGAVVMTKVIARVHPVHLMNVD